MLAGLGVKFKNAWDVRRDIAAGRLETVLDEFADDRIDRYAVQPGGLPQRRVAALVGFLDETMNDPQ